MCYILKGARNLAKPPTLSGILHATLEKARNDEKSVEEESKVEQKQEDGHVDARGLKRKLDSGESSDDQEEEKSQKGTKEMKNIKKAKNVSTLFSIRLKKSL